MMEKPTLAGSTVVTADHVPDTTGSIYEPMAKAPPSAAASGNECGRRTARAESS
jgi:hypothetical protein